MQDPVLLCPELLVAMRLAVMMAAALTATVKGQVTAAVMTANAGAESSGAR
jgi:hypothetical protein